VIWTPTALNRLERAIDEKLRVQIRRRGTEVTLVPEELRHAYGGEILLGQHLGTGDRITVPLDEVESFTVLG
jgi:hypothetical protein